MLEILYTVLIFPIEQIMELAYVFILRITRNPALSVLGISLMFSVLVLPLYFTAEKHQKEERDIQKRLKAGADTIKSVYSGDERFMLLSTYYRQNNYHPIYALRSSISLLIQIPFFIGAYHFLSHLEIIKGVSLGPINNLAKPDALLAVNGIAINVLPVLMTVINCLSAVVYTRDAPVKEKVQLYGMAAIFLVLLYNSPSALVIYWTGNNLFSLFKNIIQKTKNPKKITYVLLSLLCLFLVIYILFLHEGMILKRLFTAVIIAIIPLVPFVLKLVMRIIKKVSFKNIPKIIMTEGDGKIVFLLTATALFMLAGLVIPSNLIASSVQEFSFIENYKSPFPFLFYVFLQSLGLFVFWPACIFFMFSQKVKNAMAVTAAGLFGIAAVNAFLFSGNYGHLTLMFTFSEAVSSAGFVYIINIAAILIIFTVMLIMVFYFKKLFKAMMIITISAFLLLITVNNINIYSNFNALKIQLEENQNSSDETVYQFSKNGKNVLIIMLDRALSGFIPYIFDEKNTLYDSFSGFTWYNNTISYGMHTLFALPGILGGYEYIPEEIQTRDDIKLVNKHNEALLLMPKLLIEKNFNITVTNPSYANYSLIPDLSIFKDYPKINAQNTIGRYDASWLNKNNEKLEIDLIDTVKTYLIRFSFMKFAPMAARNIIYDRGKWLSVKPDKYPRTLISNYISLDVLPDITLINDNNDNYYNLIINELPHEPHRYFQFPDYTLVNNVTNKGNGKFANDKNYHVNIASFILIGKWLDFLKENDVYDNTRIIIISDHGANLKSDIPDNIILPNGFCLEAYKSILMVKDFNEHGKLSINDSFMTSADVPLITLNGIIENPINPWTGNEIKYKKENGVNITTSGKYLTEDHKKNTFNIKPNEWLHVHTDIYDLNNWSEVLK